MRSANPFVLGVGLGGVVGRAGQAQRLKGGELWGWFGLGLAYVEDSGA